MSIDHLDDPTRPPKPRMIPGVYNYCDSWCERCRFQQRCRSFRDRQRLDAAIASGKTIEEAFRTQYDDDDDDDDDDDEPEPGPPMKASERLQFESFLDAINEALNRKQTPEELAQEEARQKRRKRLKDTNPLSVESREYADLTRELLKVLRPVVEDRDAIVLAAVETIEYFAFTIAVKTWRAVGGTLDLGDDVDDDEMRDLSMSDANGCAKLARLLIRESRDGWEVLMNSGLGDGVPLKMIERLERLDAALADRFPRAMDFVRPGFDEQSED